MMKHGEIEKADVMIFADTGAEPPSVYRWLGWLVSEVASVMPFVKVMHKDGLTVEIEKACRGEAKRVATPPMFTGNGGRTFRECTKDFKIDPINRKLRELRGRGRVVQVFGISQDEMQRMRKPHAKWVERCEHPLIDLRMTRQDCKRWMVVHGYPIPPRSACVYCPHRCNVEWQKMRDLDPPAWEEACRMDELMRDKLPGMREKCYVHRQCVPLREAKIEDDTANHFPGAEGWGVECEGMCGV
jgi:hypothetical protein